MLCTNVYLSLIFAILKLYIFPPRLVVKAEKELAKSIAEAGCLKGFIRNVIIYRTGRLVTLRNVRYSANLTGSIKHIDGLTTLNSTEKLIFHFKENKYH